MRKRQKRVLVALGWYDYRLHRGIEKFALEHGWHLTANLTRERVIPWGWEGDGILAWLGAGDDLADFVASMKKPTVDFSLRRPQLPFAHVVEDHAHAAQLVAHHFLARGFRHFLFYSDEENWSYEARGRGFVEALQTAGHECAWLRWYQSQAYGPGREQWQKRSAWLAAQIKAAPHPLAVFAASDQQAVDVLEACELAKLSVPEDVAIVGAEDYLLAPDAMHRPISSVDTNLELLGYKGAELLDQLMRGRKPPRQPVLIPAAGIVTRMSSDILAVSHPAVAKSLRFLWEHCHEPIGVDDLARVAAMSRRGFHQAFLQHLGWPPGHELHRARIDRAKKLLADTSHKLEVIAEMCGYRSANSFWSAFKQATGLSPKDYRCNLTRRSAG